VTDILQGDVKVPGLGKTKKWVIYGVGGAAAAYVGYRWYTANRSGTSTADTGLYTTPDQTEMGSSATGGPLNIGGNTSSTVTDGTTPESIDTNAEWTQKAVELLSNAGYDPATVAAALGEFLARRALDKTEATIARAALGMVGQPPEGRPWTVIEEASTGTGTLRAPTGLAVKGTTDSTISLGWGSVSGAGSYKVYENGSVKLTVSGTSATVTGLKESTTYKFAVAAVSTLGKTGSKSGEVTAKTKAKPSTPSKPPTGHHTTVPAHHTVVAKHGDTISSIAARYHKNWQDVWNFNLKYRSASTVATFKKRGPNLIYAGTTIWVPK
jgi:chitodextrinase